MTTRRYALSDNQWERLQDRLLRQVGYVGVATKGNRLIVEAVFYRYRAGIPIPFWALKKTSIARAVRRFSVVHTRFKR